MRYYSTNCQKLSSDYKKKDLPKRTGLFPYVRVIITPQRQPARRLTGTDYQHFTANLGNIWETL